MSNSTKAKATKKPAAELQAGDIIDPPAAERGWLWRDGVKRQYTVLSVEPGKTTAKGQFVKVRATCPSPYGDKTSTHAPQFLESKLIPVY